MGTCLRVLSYNIHKGFTSGFPKLIVHKIKEAVHLVNADVVFLQEVLGEHSGHREKFENWPAKPQFEFLADEIWPHFAYGKNAIYTEGHHGNVILSRWPIVRWENINVSTSRFEQRGLLHGVLQDPESLTEVHVVCVHLSLLEGARTWQINKLCDRLKKETPDDAPLVIAGDFNDWAEVITPMLKKRLSTREVFVNQWGRHARTFPAWLPLFRLDRIYVRGLQPKEVQCLTGEPWRNLSDHAALYAELEF
jgi:endonuclease/exonuclease/phosphatase family metal-dependent hydrolase